MIIVFMSVLLGVVVSSTSRRSFTGIVETNLPALAEEGSRLLTFELRHHMFIVETIANREGIRSMDWENQVQILSDELGRTVYTNIGISDLVGDVRYSDEVRANISDQDFFQQALSGNTAISALEINRVTGVQNFRLATPIFSVDDNEITGFLIVILPALVFQELIETTGYGLTGYSYLLDESGTIIVHGTRDDYVRDRVNFIQRARSDSTYEQLAESHRRMINRESGISSYFLNGSSRYIAYHPVEGTGWSLAIAAMADEVLDPINTVMKGVVYSVICMIILGIFVSVLCSNGIMKDIEKVNKQILHLVDLVIAGNLDARCDVLATAADFKKITKGINKLIDSFIAPFNVMAEYIDRISKGDMPPIVTEEYKGDFNEIKDNLNQCINSISRMIASLNDLSENVIEGRYFYRLNEEGFKGDYLNIIQGINSSVSQVVKTIDELPGVCFRCKIDRDYTIIFISDGVRSLTGFKQSDFFDNQIRSYQSIIHPEDVQQVNHELEEGLKTKETFEFSYRIITAEKKERWIREQSRGLLNSEGELVAAERYISDLDDIKRMQLINKKRSDFTEKHINVLVEHLKTISMGNFDLELCIDESDKDTNSLKKQFEEIGVNLKKVTKTIDEISDDILEYISLTKKGEMQSISFDETIYEGSFKKIIRGLNQSAEVTYSPLIEIRDCILKIAEGDLSTKIEGEYDGLFDKLKKSANRVIDELKLLNEEFFKIDKSIEKGDLGFRADEKAVDGAYQDIIQVVNSILDKVVKPVKEISDAMNKIAKKDLAVRVTGSYEGDFKMLIMDVNEAANNLEKSLSQVDTAVDQIQSASQEISSGSQALAEGSSEQASSLEEIASSIEEISSLASNNSQNANEGKLLSEKSLKAINNGSRGMDRMNEAMSSITRSSEETSKIIKTIDEIAFQTNLLALNAAVEAAHAGEAGKGFAVVAEEVKNLALRSAEAAKNTSNLIQESMSSTEIGMKIVEEVTESFQHINESFIKVSSIVNEVTASSEEQTKGINQVNSAINELNKLTQQNAANAEESASAAEELNSQSSELKSMVDEFVLSKSDISRLRYKKHEMSKVENLRTPITDNKKPKKAYEINPSKVLPLADIEDNDFGKF